MMEPTPIRLARPGELCTCGLPAVIVYRTSTFGEVPCCRPDPVAEAYRKLYETATR